MTTKLSDGPIGVGGAAASQHTSAVKSDVMAAQAQAMSAGQPTEQMACSGCGQPKNDCTCGCSSCKGREVVNVINVGSNNHEGYNTLNPGQIERTTDRYPVPAQVVSPSVVNPQIVAPGVYSSPLVANAAASANSTTTTKALETTNPAAPLPALKTVKKQRVFFPEFL